MPGSEPCSLLASQLVTSLLGERLGGLAMLLVREGPRSLAQLVRPSGLGPREVRAGLAVLLQHGLVTTSTNKRGGVDYRLLVERVEVLLHLPSLLLLVRQQYGREGELLISSVAR